MHIAREQRLAGCRAASRDGPGVGARAGVPQAAHRVQELYLGTVALRQQVVLDDFVLPRGGQVTVHVQAQQQAIDHTPRPRLVFEQGEFQRKIIQVCGDELVDAARVRGEGRPVCRRQCDIGLLCDAPHSQFARLPVAFQQARAQDLGERATGVAAECVHLPEPVLRRHVTLDEKGILRAGGADMRLAMCIEVHSGAGGQGRIDRAGALGQWSPNVPVDQAETGGQQNSDRNVYSFDDA